MPLANEFQQKLSQQAKELRASAMPQNEGPEESPEDMLEVKNILVDGVPGFGRKVEEAIPYSTPRGQYRDPRTPAKFDFDRLDNNIYEHVWDTSEYFEVRWDGRPHRIRPGMTRQFPRYLADHFAQHLIDFILTCQEEEEKLKGLMKNRSARKNLYDQIIVGTISYYNGDYIDGMVDGLRPELLMQQASQPGANAFNAGQVVNPAAGYGLTDKPPEKIDDGVFVPAEPTDNTGSPKTQSGILSTKSRQDLMKEAKALGLDVTNTMTKDQLGEMILNF